MAAAPRALAVSLDSIGTGGQRQEEAMRTRIRTALIAISCVACFVAMAAPLRTI